MIRLAKAQCLLTAPDVFDQRDSDAVVELLTDTPPDGQEQAVRNAARGCPASAITVVDG